MSVVTQFFGGVGGGGGGGRKIIMVFSKMGNSIHE